MSKKIKSDDMVKSEKYDIKYDRIGAIEMCLKEHIETLKPMPIILSENAINYKEFLTYLKDRPDVKKIYEEAKEKSKAKKNEEVEIRFKDALDLIATSKSSVKKICKMLDFNENSFFVFLRMNDWAREQYLEAKKYQSYVFGEDVIDIMDDVSIQEDEYGRMSVDGGIVNLAKTKMQGVFKLAGTFNPGIYGNKVKNETEVTIKHEDFLKTLIEKNEKQ